MPESYSGDYLQPTRDATVAAEPDVPAVCEQGAISFVWQEGKPLVPWGGGSETYTLRQMNELLRRGVDTQLIVYGGTEDSDIGALEVPVKVLEDKGELADLPDTLVFVLEPVYGLDPLQQPSHVLLHTPVKGLNYDRTETFAAYETGGHQPIVTSAFMAQHWQAVLGTSEPPPVVYPPIDPVFSKQERADAGRRTKRLLFAGRPSASKGIYELLASLDTLPLQGQDYTLTCILIENQDEETQQINALLRAHPEITTVAARSAPAGMAALYAMHDVVVVPSLWKEPFGMVSVEAQWAGCRVVASRIGGLPETDCGGLVLAEPGDPEDLAAQIVQAMDLGPLTQAEREAAGRVFTTEASVNALLRVVRPDGTLRAGPSIV